MYKFIFLIALFFNSVVADAETLTVVVHEKVKVASHMITIGDVADVRGNTSKLRGSLQAITLKQAPRAGYTLLLNKQFIQRVIKKHRKFRRHNINVTGADETTVKLDAEAINKAAYIKKAEASLYQYLSAQHTNIELETVGVYKSLFVPVGAIELRTSVNSKQAVTRRMKVMLSVYSNGELYSKVPVWFSVKAKAFAYKTNQHIAEGVALTRDVIEQDIVDIRDMSKDVITDVSLLLNRKAKTKITKGTVVKHRHLHKKLDVIAGQDVDVYAHYRGVSLQVQALAIESGNKGQKIRLRNKSSKEVFEGIVLDKNKVKSI